MRHFGFASCGGPPVFLATLRWPRARPLSRRRVALQRVREQHPELSEQACKKQLVFELYGIRLRRIPEDPSVDALTHFKDDPHRVSRFVVILENNSFLVAL